MLKDLIASLNTSSLENASEAYNLIKHHYPNNINEVEFTQQFKKPALEDFSLIIGTNKDKLEALRQELKKQQFAAYILSTNDEYLNEYTPMFAKRLFYITGFNGSYGFAVITLNSAALFVDGRYTAQAAEQVDSNLFQVLPLSYNNIISYLTKNLTPNEIIALNSKTISYSLANLIETELHKANLKLTFLNNDLIDNIWQNQPPEPISPIFIYHEKYAGESTNTKLNKIIKYLEQENLDALLVPSLDNIAWLLNIRGNDIECSPLTLASLIIYKNGKLDLFTNKLKLLPEISKYLENNHVTCYNSAELINKLQQLNNKTVGLHADSSYFYYKELNNISTIRILNCDIVANLKAIKNTTEYINTQIAHYKDGAALTKLILWLNYELENRPFLTELEIVSKINYFKISIDSYKSNSFPSIVASNANAAFPHYQATEKTNGKIDTSSILLIDCGGQYLEGTTDVTRTLSFNSASKEFKHYFTLVLKGLIALSTLKFPKGTPCCNLDVLARQFLWQEGEDYNHGTGHGVGHYLSVHEGPIRFNQTNKEPLAAGMIISIEPGLYKLNKFGIRIENLVITKECKEHPNFLEFHSLTAVPIDIKNIDFAMLTITEKNWITSYHQTVINKLTPYLSKDELIKLKLLIEH